MKIYIEIFKKWGALLCAFIFFVLGLVTISDYNINWDEPPHFARGQAYLRLITTGEKNYEKLPRFKEFQEDPRRVSSDTDFFPRYSIYQNSRTAGHFLKQDSGHPPLNGILAAFSNFVFYQKLGLIGDVESYHLFIIFISSLLIFLVFHWLQSEFSLFSAVVGVIALGTLPLFLGESHNNIKDPVQTTFFTFAIYFFYTGIQKKSFQKIIFSSVFTGLALATKFNIVFFPFILFPWLFFYFIGRSNTLNFLSFLNHNKRILLSLVIFPFIAFSILYFSWPFLWQDPVGNFLKITKYYKDIGSGSINQPAFIVYGFNTYPVLTMLFTTPLVTLTLFIVGLFFSICNFQKEKGRLLLLLVLWFSIPLIRVTMPGTSIYGGIRQIMEYVPAMAMLSGIGAYYLVVSFYRRIATLTKLSKDTVVKLLQVAILLSFIPIVLKLISIHPNENVYFNPLIGGLKGAYERNFPSWGFALGNPYRQGVEWLNAHAEKNAKVALITSTGPNIPSMFFRKDIKFGNGHYSGPDKKGEYLVEGVYDGWIRVYYYAAEYAENLLIPVHEVKVDGVPILKVWKNDLEHTREGYKNEIEVDSNAVSWNFNDNILAINLTKNFQLSKIVLSYQSTCIPFASGRVFVSNNKENWTTISEPIREWMIQDERIMYPLVAVPAQYIKIKLDLKIDSCDFDITKVSVWHF